MQRSADPHVNCNFKALLNEDEEECVCVMKTSLAWCINPTSVLLLCKIWAVDEDMFCVHT